MELSPNDAKDLAENGAVYFKRLRNCLAPKNTTDDRYIPIAGATAAHGILAYGGLLTPVVHAVGALPGVAQFGLYVLYGLTVKYGADLYMKCCYYVARKPILWRAQHIEERQGYDAAQRYLSANGEPQ